MEKNIIKGKITLLNGAVMGFELYPDVAPSPLRTSSSWRRAAFMTA